MALSRASRTCPTAVLTTPASTTARPAAPASSTPKPVATSPGSTPIIRSARAGAAPVRAVAADTPGQRASSILGRGDGLDDLVRDVVIGVHRLNVVLLLD